MSQPPESRVDAADVRNVKFQLIRRGGYDPGQVDPFLEVVAQTLEGGPYADWRINGEYIHGVRFTTVRRGGYMPAQVDAFLDRVIDTFDAATREGRHPSDEASAPASAPVGADAAPEWPSMPQQPASLGPEILPPASVGPEILPPAPIAADAPLVPPLIDEPVPAAEAPPAPDPEPTIEVAAAVDTSPEADFERLRILHESGVLSDKEFAVLGARVKRRINAQQSAVVG